MSKFRLIIKVERIGTVCAVNQVKVLKMSTIGKRVALVLGVAAGAALAAFATSKSGKKEIRRISDRTQGMRNDLLNMIDKDVTRLKKMSQRFI